MREIGTILAGIGAAFCWYFVTAYWVSTRGDWRLTAAGRHVMQFTGNLGVLLLLIVAARIWPDYPGRDVITNTVFGVFIGQIGWRIVLLHRAQHTRVRDRTRSAGR